MMVSRYVCQKCFTIIYFVCMYYIMFVSDIFLCIFYFCSLQTSMLCGGIRQC